MNEKIEKYAIPKPGCKQWTVEEALDWLNDHDVTTYHDLSAFEVFEIHGNLLFFRVKSWKELEKLKHEPGHDTHNDFVHIHWDSNGILEECRESCYVAVVEMNNEEEGFFEVSCGLYKQEFQVVKNLLEGRECLLKQINNLSVEQIEQAKEFLLSLSSSSPPPLCDN